MRIIISRSFRYPKKSTAAYPPNLNAIHTALLLHPQTP